MVTKDNMTTGFYDDTRDGDRVGRCVYVAGLARQLIRMGYKVIDIKPNRANRDKSVFVFEPTDEFENDLARLVDKIKEKRENSEGKNKVNEEIRKTFLDKPLDKPLDMSFNDVSVRL